MAGPEFELIDSIRQRIQNLDTKEGFEKIPACLGLDREFWMEWVALVNESAFPLDEWIIATGRIIDWRKNRGLSVEAGGLIGYLACCEEVAGEMAGGLVGTVEGMLATHGMVDSVN